MANLLKHADDEQATMHHGLDICPGRLETILASMALFVLRLMRPKIPLDHVRLEWFSACGVQVYADYPECDDIVEFQKGLGDTQKRPPSFAHMIGVEGRPGPEQADARLGHGCHCRYEIRSLTCVRSALQCEGQRVCSWAVDDGCGCDFSGCGVLPFGSCCLTVT
jgi:hypothetical protein